MVELAIKQNRRAAEENAVFCNERRTKAEGGANVIHQASKSDPQIMIYTEKLITNICVIFLRLALWFCRV